MFKRECRWVERVLWGLAAGREDAARAARVHAHLRQCPACRVQWQAVQQTQSGLTALRDRPVPASQTDWRQVQALITQVPDCLPAASQRAQTEVASRKRVAGKRLRWSGATAVLALCGLLIGAARLPHEADISMRAKTEATADSAYKFRSLTLDASLPQSVTFSGALPNAWNAAPSMQAIRARTAAQSTRRRYAAANIRPHRFYAYSATFTGQSGRRRRRLALAALHRQRRAERLAALQAEQYPELNPIALTANAVSVSRVEPEYVMTTADMTAPTARHFVMDSINVDAQNSGQTNVDGLAVPRPADSQNILDNGQGSRPGSLGAPDDFDNSPVNKEIRAW